MSFLSACVDFITMTGFAALERTEIQFRTLLESVGLLLVDIWSFEEEKPEGEGRCLVKAVLKI